MKKLVLVLGLIAGMGMIGTPVFADPGPYAPTMNADGYDSTPDLIQTPNDTSTGVNAEAPQIHDTLNYVFVNAGLANPNLTKNEETDPYQFVNANAYWQDLNSGDASNFAVISITAGNTNTLGVYKFGDPLNATFFPSTTATGKQFLGNGSFADPYSGAINPLSGDNFGFALKSQELNGAQVIKETKFYSDPSLNSDKLDHMLAFYLPQLEGKSVWIDLNNDGTADQEIVLSKNTYLLAWEDLAVTNSNFDSDYNDTIFLVTKVAPIPEPMTMVLFGSGLMGLVGLRKKRS